MVNNLPKFVDNAEELQKIRRELDAAPTAVRVLSAFISEEISKVNKPYTEVDIDVNKLIFREGRKKALTSLQDYVIALLHNKGDLND